MSGFLVDANVLVYAAAADEVGERCRDLLRGVAEGRIDGHCSTAILEEVWHLELSGRLPELEGFTGIAHQALAPLLPVTDETFAAALELRAPELGANDRIHVATARSAGLAAIASADRGFDDVAGIERIDVLERGPVERLINSS